jgi:uridine kinase
MATHMAHENILIGLAGGSGSGKTTVTKTLRTRFGDGEVTVVEQDNYYRRPPGHLSLEERAKINYDHPAAFDDGLLVEHVTALLEGRAVERPVYDFVHHTRGSETVLVRPSHVIILEGILVLENEPLRDLMDIKLFVDTDADVRILRRLQRDMKERGRTLESVVHQYLSVVRPMHLQFVEPSKRHADLIIPEGGQNQVALDLIVAKIEQLLARRTHHAPAGYGGERLMEG